MEISALTIVYAANILVAGFAGCAALFGTHQLITRIFGEYFTGGSVRVVGSFWSTIAILSLVGLFFPMQMVPVLLVQLGYQSIWLLVFALPRLFREAKTHVPHTMTWFFIIWVAALPFIIPWSELFSL